MKYGKTYYWKVVAEDTYGASTTSDIYTFVTQLPLIVSGSSDNIYSVDISDKEDPEEINSKNITSNATIIIDGTYAYIARDEGFYIYDASPTNLSEISNNATIAKNLVNLDKEGNYVYALSKDASRLIIYDVSDPQSITLAATVATDLSAEVKAIDVEGNYAYIVDKTNGLVVYDISNNNSPTLAASYTNEIMNPTDIVVNDSYAFITCGASGVVVMDISNPENPAYISRLKYKDDDTNAVAIYWYNNKLYVANNSSNSKGISVINAVYPENMYEERFISVGSGDPTDVFVNDKYIYVAAKSGGLRVLDESGEKEVGSYGNDVINIGGIYSE
ncbi:LVIVD repeat-containing protein [Marinitoga lauensis]|uniref:LVIVD repeat-containing protein n=1 Tax=Marinitoga lauensis TaxID=2201189 RepID=UPI0010111C2D|nr:hypothetical protein [Marinitoga lauensis]